MKKCGGGVRGAFAVAVLLAAGAMGCLSPGAAHKNGFAGQKVSGDKESRRTMPYEGKWYGPEAYYGLHYDIHAGAKDTEIGLRLEPGELKKSLELMGPQWVQTDCKGHPGMTSWFSETPEATVSPGVKKDALAGWREATKMMGVPLHCHYSGIWDKAAAEKHPEWAVVPNPAARDDKGQPLTASEKMCPRRGYLEGLMLPQMFELIDRYGVDGFWVDGDLWAVEACYCEACREAFTRKTGIKEAPTDKADPDWVAWMTVTREGFEEYVTKYCDAIHRERPGVLVCSNWLQTFNNPGEPRVPTDWISGDNSWVWGMDGSRCEARFISTRGKPWDIMLWSFYCMKGMGPKESPWVAKPPEMLMQEAAVTLALGGNVQIYVNPMNLRDGRLADWWMRRQGEVGRFVKARRELCQGSETIPQVAVLHSETHHYSQAVENLHWGYDPENVRGAVFAMLENSYGVDVMDEWALLPVISRFPIVVAPEEERMSQAAVEALKKYVEDGGRLLLTGADVYDRFGEEFIGAKSVKVEEDARHNLAAGDGIVPVYSKKWRLLEPTTARPLGFIYKTILTDDGITPYPSATLNKVGRGAVLYVPCGVFNFYWYNRYPMVRQVAGEWVRVLEADLDIRVQAPAAVDVTLRKKGGKTIVHLINRSSGLPNNPRNGAIDEIFPVGPVSIEMRAKGRPKSVKKVFEEGAVEWKFSKGGNGGTVEITVPQVRIHAGVEVEPR